MALIILRMVFLLVAGWLLINTLVTSPTQSFTGLGLIIIGLPVYYFFNNRRDDTSEPNDGKQ